MDEREEFQCKKCGEFVYVGMEARHAAKDHDPIEELAWEYGLEPETIEALIA